MTHFTESIIEEVALEWKKTLKVSFVTRAMSGKRVLLTESKVSQENL
jgi:hypothetical protein